MAAARLVEGLPSTGAQAVLAAAVHKTYCAGEILFLQGEPAEALILVETGAIKLWQVTPEGDEVVVGGAGPGTILAAIVVLGRRMLPISATASAPTAILSWSRTTVLDLVEKYPQLRMNVLQAIADRMQDSLVRLREISTESVDRRIAHALLRMAREAGRQVPEGILIDRALGRRELAEMAGASMFTASRVVAAWAREGVLEVGRQRVLVRDPERLAALAGESAAGS